MKKQFTVHNRIMVLGILLGFLSLYGCNSSQTKEALAGTSIATRQPVLVKRFTDVRYYSFGKIASLNRYHTDGTLQNNYTFSYEKGRLAAVDFGGRWEYVYLGEVLTGIKTYNEKGKLKYLYAFNYEGKLLKEKLESFVTDVGVTHPLIKSTYEYGMDGKVTKKEIFLIAGEGWIKNKTELYSGYDNTVGVDRDFDNVPYMPTGILFRKQPCEVSELDKEGRPLGTRTYQYVYDGKGRMINKETVFHASARNPGYAEQTAIQYGKDIQN